MPFTYLVRFRLTGQIYYGYRGRKGCSPDDLWTSYFTSSRIVAGLIREHGPDAFDVEVRRTFRTADAARKCERRVLLRFDARSNPCWLNQTNGGKGFSLKAHTLESRRKISESRTGIAFSDEHRRKIGLASRGRVIADETKERISAALSGRVVSEETRDKLRITASRRQHSAETRAKIGRAGRGRTLSQQALERRPSSKRCVAEGVEYRSLSEAAKALGTSVSGVRYRIDAGRSGYHFLD